MLTYLSLAILSTTLSAAQCELIKDPTLKPADPFVASADAGIIKNEIIDPTGKYDVNNNKIADIMCRRTYDQRRQIAAYYDGTICPQVTRYYDYYHRCPLYTGLQDVSNGSLDDVYTDMLIPPEKLLARTVYDSIRGKWKEKGAIEEVICANDQEMKKLIQQVYLAEYKTTVEAHVGTFHNDDKQYQDVMLKYCWAARCQNKKITPENAAKEAKVLQDINPDQDKESFKKKLKEYMENYCEPDLKSIFEKYEKDGHRISDGVDKAFSGREKTAFNALVRYIENTCRFYADELHHAMDGAGTDVDKINRIVVTRCERDLSCVLDQFKKHHKKSFTKRLKEDTTCEPRYRRCIKHLCGK